MAGESTASKTIPGPAAVPSPGDAPPIRPGGGDAGGRYRVLVFHPGPVPPNTDSRKNMLYHLSSCCEGDLVTTRWKLPEDARGARRPVRFDTLGDFEYHATCSTRLPGLLRTAWIFAYSLWTGLRLSRAKGAYDAIYVYGPYTLSLAGWILRSLTGAKLIIMMPSAQYKAFQYVTGPLGQLKSRVARRLTPMLLRRADAMHLLYPGQLDGLDTSGFPPATVFHDLVPVSMIQRSREDDRYIFFIGYPWNLKGVDILIRAFHRIAPQYPDIGLKVVGHCPDRSPFERLAEGHPRITFYPGLPHGEAMALMARCSVFVLPSRTEAMGRVLLEAMATGKPIVASRVDGIPTYIEHERNGLLFESGDIEGLAENLDRLLGDPEYARQLAEEGHRRAVEELSEQRFVERFREMLESVVGHPATLDNSSRSCS